jgi:hypothetical protein
MIMRLRPANSRLINRRSNLPQAAARSVLGKRLRQKQPHCFARVDTVTPCQANALVEYESRVLDCFRERRFSGLIEQADCQ